MSSTKNVLMYVPEYLIKNPTVALILAGVTTVTIFALAKEEKSKKKKRIQSRKIVEQCEDKTTEEIILAFSELSKEEDLSEEIVQWLRSIENLKTVAVQDQERMRTCLMREQELRLEAEATVEALQQELDKQRSKTNLNLQIEKSRNTQATDVINHLNEELRTEQKKVKELQEQISLYQSSTSSSSSSSHHNETVYTTEEKHSDQQERSSLSERCRDEDIYQSTSPSVKKRIWTII